MKPITYKGHTITIEKERIELEALTYADSFRYKQQENGWRDEIKNHWLAGHERAQQTIQKQSELLDEMAEALRKAKRLIQGWHDMNDGLALGEGSEAWKIYDRHAPEMKPINSVLEKYKAEQ